MVERQLAARGITDARVLEAMAAVPREAFVAEGDGPRAYSDRALALGPGQTISQPWIVAAICQALALSGGEVVLEIGAGSGYSSAVLARLASTVLAIELDPGLARRAAGIHDHLGIPNVEMLAGDGSRGLPDRAPFDAIAVHAAIPRRPDRLIAQLRPGGRLVAPVAEGRRAGEVLTLYERGTDGPEAAETPIAPCRFVPLIQ